MQVPAFFDIARVPSDRVLQRASQAYGAPGRTESGARATSEDAQPGQAGEPFRKLVEGDAPPPQGSATEQGGTTRQGTAQRLSANGSPTGDVERKPEGWRGDGADPALAEVPVPGPGIAEDIGAAGVEEDVWATRAGPVRDMPNTQAHPPSTVPAACSPSGGGVGAQGDAPVPATGPVVSPVPGPISGAIPGSGAFGAAGAPGTPGAERALPYARLIESGAGRSFAAERAAPPNTSSERPGGPPGAATSQPLAGNDASAPRAADSAPPRPAKTAASPSPGLELPGGTERLVLPPQAGPPVARKVAGALAEAPRAVGLSQPAQGDAGRPSGAMAATNTAGPAERSTGTRPALPASPSAAASPVRADSLAPTQTPQTPSITGQTPADDSSSSDARQRLSASANPAPDGARLPAGAGTIVASPASGSASPRAAPDASAAPAATSLYSTPSAQAAAMDPDARMAQTAAALAGDIAAASAITDGQARRLRVTPATTSTTQAMPLPARGHGGGAGVPGAGATTGETFASRFAGAQLLPGGEPRGESPFSPAADLLAPGDTRTGASTAPAAETAPRPSIAPGVAQQIAEAMRSALPAAAAPGSLEVALQPEDLGRVRLVFTPAEAGLTISIQAERSETLEMLRRHIDLLASDLRDQGFANLSFEFAGGDTPGGRETPYPYPSPDSARDTAAHPDDAPLPAALRPPIPGLSSGHASLDLRL